MPVRIGTSPNAWGVWYPNDPRQPPWWQFLDEVAGAGYRAIELGPYGYLPSEAETLRSALRERGLTLTGAVLMEGFDQEGVWPRIRPEVERLCGLLEAVDGGYLILVNTLYSDLQTGEVLGPRALAEPRWRGMLEVIHELADSASAHGIRTLYHPHAEAIVEYENQIERLLADTDERLISLCLDTGHHAYRRGDPAAFMRRHHERIPYVHLKGIDAAVRDEVDREQLPFAVAVRKGIFTELSQGVVDHVALRVALDQLGFDGWGVVEQDFYPVPGSSPMAVATRNLEHLRQSGYDR